MKKLITALFAIGLSATAVAQDQPMALPINMPCMSPDKANEMMKKYNEVPFAQADGIIISMVNNEFYNTNLKMNRGFNYFRRNARNIKQK